MVPVLIGIHRNGVRRASTPAALIPGLVDWWTASDTSTLWQDVAGTVTPVTADGQSVGCWRGKYANTALAAQGLGNRDPYKTGRLGSRAAVAFSGSNNGLIGTLTHTFTNGATWIILGQFTGLTSFRAAASCGGSNAGPGGTNATSIPNGFVIDVGSPSTNVEVIRNNVSLLAPISNATPYMMVATWNQTIVGPSNIDGISTSAGIEKVYLNGGLPQGFALYSDQTPIVIAYASLGCRTDTYFGAAIDISDAFLVDGECTPKTLQNIVNNWVLPSYGVGVF